MAGADCADVFSRAPRHVEPLGWPPRVGVPGPWPSDVELDDELRAAFEAAVSRLSALGVPIVPIDLGPALELGEMLYGSAIVAERVKA